MKINERRRDKKSVYNGNHGFADFFGEFRFKEFSLAFLVFQFFFLLVLLVLHLFDALSITDGPVN